MIPLILGACGAGISALIGLDMLGDRGRRIAQEHENSAVRDAETAASRLAADTAVRVEGIKAANALALKKLECEHAIELETLKLDGVRGGHVATADLEKAKAATAARLEAAKIKATAVIEAAKIDVAHAKCAVDTARDNRAETLLTRALAELEAGNIDAVRLLLGFKP